jgi:hypothetical protein
MAAIERRLGQVDEPCIYDLLLDFERSDQADAGAAWIGTLGQWAVCWRCDGPRRWLRSCVQGGLARAVEDLEFTSERLAAYPREDVAGWVQEFVAGIDLDELLRSPVGRVRLIGDGLASTRA